MKTSLLVFAFGAALLGGCGVIEEARMRAPNAPPGEVETVALTDMSYGASGRFRLGGSEGRFQRGAAKSSLFDFTERSGGGRFSVAGADVDGEVEGRCFFHEGEIDLSSSVAVKARPLSYRCDFARDGRPIAAHLELYERGTFKDARKGRLVFQGRRIDVRSVHEIEGGRAPTLSPIGYVFAEDGREIGGVDLNGGTKTLFLPRDPELREAAVAASLALSIFWDPAVFSAE